MHEKTRQRVEDYAVNIFKDLILKGEPDYIHDGSCYAKAYKILEKIMEGPQTIHQIAYHFDMSSDTIFEYVGALTTGGVPINKTSTPNSKGTGRSLTVVDMGPFTCSSVRY